MSRYRRNRTPGGTFFFTVNTYRRQKLFNDPKTRAILRAVFEKIQRTKPFQMIALCLLPEHIHCIWTLPESDADYSSRWGTIKGHFTREYGAYIGSRPRPGTTRRESAFWQRRFWEHHITGEADLNRHIDYIHYNPVKHGLVNTPADWEWSTFGRFVKQGIYEPTWGESVKAHFTNMRSAGE